jgi:dUTP pyrophosphatase
MEIYVKYHIEELKRIERIAIGNWIDLRAAETITLKAGDFCVISLGVSMKLPDGYEAWVAPRSSTFRTWGVLQANGIGIIDSTYSGDDDVWLFPAFATRDVTINMNDRICQFRIVPIMPDVAFVTVDALSGENRGGFGSTGTNTIQTNAV